MINTKKEALKTSVDSAISAIQPLLAQSADDPQAQQRARDILRAINYGKDGYIV